MTVDEFAEAFTYLPRYNSYASKKLGQVILPSSFGKRFNDYVQKEHDDIVIEFEENMVDDDTITPPPRWTAFYGNLWKSFFRGFAHLPQGPTTNSFLVVLIECLAVSFLNFAYFLFGSIVSTILLLLYTFMCFIMLGIVLPFISLINWFIQFRQRVYYRRFIHCVISYLDTYLSKFRDNPWLCTILLILFIVSWTLKLNWLFNIVVQIVECYSIFLYLWEDRTGKEDDLFPWEFPSDPEALKRDSIYRPKQGSVSAGLLTDDYSDDHIFITEESCSFSTSSSEE